MNGRVFADSVEIRNKKRLLWKAKTRLRQIKKSYQDLDMKIYHFEKSILSDKFNLCPGHRKKKLARECLYCGAPMIKDRKKNKWEVEL